jgi:hypothetical protein
MSKRKPMSSGSTDESEVCTAMQMVWEDTAELESISVSKKTEDVGRR